MKRIRPIKPRLAIALIWVAVACDPIGAQVALDPRCERQVVQAQQMVTEAFGVGSAESEATFGMLKAILTAFSRSKEGRFSVEEQAAVKRFTEVAAAAQGKTVEILEAAQARLRGKSESERKKLLEGALGMVMHKYFARDDALKAALRAVAVCGGR